MKSKALSNSLKKLQTEEPGLILEAIAEVNNLHDEITEESRYDVLSHLLSFYYIDTYEYPRLQHVVEAAIDCIASFGPNTVPFLLSQIAGTDVKAQLNLAVTVGKIGKGAYEPLMAFYRNQKDDSARAFALYALGKIKDECVAEAVPEIVACLTSENKELKDTAARTIGKIAEVVNSKKVGADLRDRIFEGIYTCLDDGYSGVRAKAARTLGKLVRFGYLSNEQKEKGKSALTRMAGKSSKHRWDKAYIVRREAELSLRYFD